MNITPTLTLAHAARRRRTLSSRWAFALLGSTVLTLLASSAAPTPLYALYQARWGFSDVTVTVIFGVYAVAVIASLLVFGSLSDHVGRRPIVGAALVAQAFVMLLFAFAGSLDALLAARVLQGLATGAALGAIGAGLVDLHPARGAMANAASAMAGTASGALVAALAVQLLPDPTRLVYLALAVVFVLQAVGINATVETSSRRPGALHALRPTLGVPSRARAALAITAPSLVAVWALAGFYASLGPSLAGLIAHTGSTLLGGVAMFVLAASGSATVVIARAVEPQRLVIIGNGLVVAGVGVVLVAVSTLSLPLFLLGTVVAGAGFGGGFQGGLRTIVPLAEPHERAGLISVAYLISYLAMGLPAIGAGVLVVHSTLARTAQQFGVAVMALSLLTIAGMVVAARRDAGVVVTMERSGVCREAA